MHPHICKGGEEDGIDTQGLQLNDEISIITILKVQELPQQSQPELSLFSCSTVHKIPYYRVYVL